MDHESAFLIRSRSDIISKLALLRKYKCLLTVSFNDNESSFITTILEITKDHVIFYHGPQKQQLEQLQKSEGIHFRTEHNGVKVFFESNRFIEKRVDGALVYAIPIPDSITWVEARDFYRIKIPEHKPAFCLIAPNGAIPIKLKLLDISLSGFSAVNDTFEVSKVMNPNIYFKDCKLVLNEWIEEVISFEIRHKYVFKAAHLKRSEKIGCKFIAPSQAFENVIQSYILQIEREYRQNQSVNSVESPVPTPKSIF